MGKGVKKIAGNITKTVNKAVKDVGTAGGKAIGDTVSQVGRTVKDKGTIEAGRNITRESKTGMEKYSPILAQLAGNAFIPGYGLASGGLNALASGDMKQLGLAALGGLGSAGGQSLISNLTGGAGSSFLSPTALNLAKAGLTGDKRGLASSLAGFAGFGDSTSNLIGSLASGDKRGIAQGLGGALGLSPELNRALAGAATGDNRDIAMGLLGATGYVDPKRLAAMDALAGGKLTMENAKTAFGDLLPSMGFGGEGGEGGDGGPSWLKSIQDLGAGFSTSGLTPDFLKGISTSGLLPSVSGLLPSGISTSGLISGFAPGGLSTSGMFGGGEGDDGKGSQNWEALKDIAGDVGDFVDGATDAVGNFVGRNKGVLGTGLGALGTKAAYDQYMQRWKVREQLVDKQRKDLEAAGQDYQAMKYDPKRYEEYKQFLSDRIAGQGIGAKEKQMQQEGDIRAGRAAAGQRAAALEQMARMGSGATGSGAALASALAGGQSAMDIQSQTNLAREASAQENLEQALAKKSGLSTQATKEEADLASQQAKYRLEQLDKIGAQRGLESGLQQELGQVHMGLAQYGTDTLTKLLEGYESPAQREQRKKLEDQQRKMAALETQKKQEQEAYQAELRQAELDKKRAEAEALRRGQTGQQTTPPPAAQTPVPKPAPKPVPAPQGPTQSQINQALNRGSYTIQKGDTLSGRYRDLGYGSVKEAYEANKDLIGDNMNLIKTGNTLRRKDEIQDKRISTPIQDINKKYSGSNIA